MLGFPVRSSDPRNDLGHAGCVCGVVAFVSSILRLEDPVSSVVAQLEVADCVDGVRLGSPWAVTLSSIHKVYRLARGTPRSETAKDLVHAWIAQGDPDHHHANNQQGCDQKGECALYHVFATTADTVGFNRPILRQTYASRACAGSCPPERAGYVAVFSLVVIRLKTRESEPPSVLAAAIIPTAMRAAIRPYPMAVAPDSSRTKRRISFSWDKLRIADDAVCRVERLERPSPSSRRIHGCEVKLMETAH